MGLRDQAKADIEQITSNLNDWGISMVFKAPNAATATITGLHAIIRLGVDTDGTLVNSKKASIAFSEKFLVAAGYPVRNTKGMVDLKDHLVDVKDSTGTIRNYVIQQWFPDETIGLISCILEYYEQN